MSIVNRVKEMIESSGLLEVGDRIIVGVSGGPDSLALLHILKRLQPDYKLDLHIAHLDHKLRGKDSREDAQFVEEIADKWSLPITVERKDVKAYQKKAGLSLEDAARKVRYNFFFDLVKKLNFDKVAVGHHADDQAETVIMKFIRGAGLKGLGGMKPKKRRLIRPLLRITKDQIRSYCSEYNLNPRFDATNAHPVQLRNKIRLELIPLLKEEYNENLIATLNRNAEIWQQEDDFLRNYARESLEEVSIRQEETKLIIDKNKLLNLNRAIKRRVIREAVNSLLGSYKDFYYCHVKDIMELVMGESGKKLELPRGLVVRLNYNQVIFSTEKLANEIDYFENKVFLGKNEISELDLIVNSKVINASYSWQEEIEVSNKEFFDFDKIGAKFKVRQRKPGDSFIPLGMDGSKKVKDFLIDEKIPYWKRDQIPVFVTPAGEIFWVGGIRIDDRFKVTNATDKILMIEIIR